MHGIAWYCIVLHGIAWYCMVLHGIALYCIVLHCIALYCMVLHDIAWYCMVWHGFTWYCIVLHGIAWYCMVLHYLAPSCTILHHLAPSCTINHKQQPLLKQVWRCVSYDFDKHLATCLPSLSLSLIIAVNFGRFVLRGRKGSKSEGAGHCCVYESIEILCYNRRNNDLQKITTCCKSFVSVSSFIVTKLLV